MKDYRIQVNTYLDQSPIMSMDNAVPDLDLDPESKAYLETLVNQAQLSSPQVHPQPATDGFRQLPEFEFDPSQPYSPNQPFLPVINPGFNWNGKQLIDPNKAIFEPDVNIMKDGRDSKPAQVNITLVPVFTAKPKPPPINLPVSDT
ncbi:hypothetical protein Ciccas_014182, partial [Cichlidogyrus casuarinus]